MAALPLTGGCACGGVRFEIDAAARRRELVPLHALSAADGTPASPQARIVPGSLRVVRGEELLRAWEPPTAAGRRCSAASAASALWSRSPDDPGVMSVRLGAFDGDPGIRPEYRQFVAYAAAWDPIPDDGLPRFPERRPA